MKPLRPFPLPFNIGTDICQISRIYGIITGGGGARAQRFIDRVLAPEEQAASRSRLRLGPARKGGGEAGTGKVSNGKGGDGLRSNSLMRDGAVGDTMSWREIERRDPEVWRTATFMAGRFAAKEAAIKAHAPRRKLTFHDVILEKVEGHATEEGQSQRLGSGAPVARIRGNGSSAVAAAAGGGGGGGGDQEGKGASDGEAEDTSAMISISHDGDYATAVCLSCNPDWKMR